MPERMIDHPSISSSRRHLNKQNPVISKYAIPAEIDRVNYQRTCHDQDLHLRALNSLIENHLSQRVISIHLCDKPTICAFLDGILVDTSCGYSLAGGLPGLTTSGMIDPSLPLMMLSAGLQAGQIRDLLLTSSGYQTLRDGDDSLVRMADPADQTTIKIVRFLIHHLLKSIGEMIAVLEGVDALVIITDSLDWLPFTKSFLLELEWIGIKINSHDPVGEVQHLLTAADSSIKVYYI